MRIFFLALILMVALVLQTTVLEFLTILGVRPDLVLLIVILFGFIHGSRAGVYSGFLGGLLTGFLAGNYIGLSVLAQMAAGYLAGMGENRFYKENLLIAIIVVMVGTSVAQIIYWLLLLMLGINIMFVNGLKIILIVALYNGALTLFLYKWFYHVNTRGILKKPELE
ncbi:rod shape-determining protein MreD [Peptococcaceae bacterium]|nr:rod shape-determining protein MreD [Peptococcaceae bacterium]